MDIDLKEWFKVLSTMKSDEEVKDMIKKSKGLYWRNSVRYV